MNAVVRDKRLVAQSFSRAAPTYDSVAGLQRSVADSLLARLPDATPEVVLDLGSGTGYASTSLRQRYPQALLLSLDLAEGMLGYARSRHSLTSHHHVCGDAEALPLADNSVDLIYSSLAIQWCEQPACLFAELRRVLKPGGWMLIATLGPGTLAELKQAWAQVDDDCHVNEFCPLSELRAAAAGLVSLDESIEQRVLEYDQLGELMHELKALGAHNVNPRQQQGLSGISRLRTLSRAYDGMRLDSGALPASYEVYYLAWMKDSA
ncbi:malonyl-[acyl-carrier protein] O-methyltransferase [Marinobacterium zhoushanense]|uniref:Malonyl-[acyl-carrier protein] O-methyltransferase n=1 Tax=Marinobacterium zhoushanense TaxID=1679163 RepID=A0ABQ1K5M2_9GAMM|nr:malonyl-ACP O-methyltransferase BioC [Marinobacterium zhoushanense]GGB88312.1 malonyl-[acyl-carrier protein] O-methyltransferase [Marinobacterium zhoushanense]